MGFYMIRATTIIFTVLPFICNSSSVSLAALLGLRIELDTSFITSCEQLTKTIEMKFDANEAKM